MMQEAVATLGNLVSNAETMAAWAKERLTNKELDFREEVLELLRRIDVDVHQPPIRLLLSMRLGLTVCHDRAVPRS